MKQPENPYFGLTEAETTRLQSRIGKEDYAFLRNILVNGNGNVQLIVNYLVLHFINTCKHHGIQTFLQRDELWALLEREYPLAGRTPAPVTRKAAAGTKRRRTTRPRDEAEGTATEPTNPEGNPQG